MFFIRSNGTLNSVNTEKRIQREISKCDDERDNASLTTLVYDIFSLNILNCLGDSPWCGTRLLLNGGRRYIRGGECYCTWSCIRVRLAILVAIVGALHVDNVQAKSFLFGTIVCIYRYSVVVVIIVDNCAGAYAILYGCCLNLQMLRGLLAGIDDGRGVGKGQVCGAVCRVSCDRRWRDCYGGGSISTRAHRVIVLLWSFVRLSFSSSFVRCEESNWTRSGCSARERKRRNLLQICFHSFIQSISVRAVLMCCAICSLTM